MTLPELRSTWEELGRTDPLWAVLTNPELRDGGWDLDEFLATGEPAIDGIVKLVANRELTLGDRVLDFGCGVGRLSNALAGHVTSVVGVDIAASMIDHAKRINRHPDRLTFAHYEGASLPFADASFDSAVSLMVLQHASPAIQIASLLELRRVVRPGGVIVVQIPSQPWPPRPLDRAAMRARIEPLDIPRSLSPGAERPLAVSVTNLSEATWPAGQMIKLGDRWTRPGSPGSLDDGRADLPHDIEPGQSVRMALPITAPSAEGRWQLELDMVQEFVAWWGDEGSEPARATVAVTVTPPEPAAAESGESALSAPSVVVADESDPSGIEMHGLHIDLVRSLLAHCDCAVLDAIPDTLAGEEWESFVYLVQRR